MRITVFNPAGLADGMKAVDSATEQLLRTQIPGMLRLDDVEKKWNGSTTSFSLLASIGPFRAPIRGTVLVTATEITIECDLPGLLTRLFSESTIRAEIESRIRGLLGK